MLPDERIPQIMVVGPDGVVRRLEVGYAPGRLDEIAGSIETLLPR